MTVPVQRGVGSPSIDLSVVVPVYNCASCLPELRARVAAVLERLTDSWELVLVDDRAGDGSWDVVGDLAKRDRHIVAIRLSRNFGQHSAVTAGLAASRGAHVIVMDFDLQDPPEDIPRLCAKANEGYDIVYTRRSERRHSGFRRAAGVLYFRLLNKVAGTGIDRRYGSFTLISRKVVDAYLALRDQDRHYLFILYWLGFSHTAIDYEHGERHSGESSYGIVALTRHALGGLFFQTTVLLRWIMYFGFAFAAAGMALAALLVGARAFNTVYPGWTSVVVAILITGGVIITSIGVMGLYLGKVFEQVKDRPLYVIDEVLRASIADEEPTETLERAVVERVAP
jgi:dolichol-phosphate mannosyltransferase